MKRKIGIVVVLVACAFLAGLAYLYHSITDRVAGEFFDSDGIRIHFTVEGEGEPLILIHGFAANADLNWRKPGVLQKLAKEYKVIAIDNRGHGLSEKPHEESAYGLPFCEDVIRLMDHLGIPKAHVVGYSMGAFITLKLVTLHPDRVISAVAGGAGWEDPESGEAERYDIANALDYTGNFGPLFEAISPPGKAPEGWVLRQINFTLSLTNDTEALAHVMRALDGLVVAEAELRANSVPLLSIVGADDPLRAGVDRMNGVMGRHESIYIEGGDHISTIADPAFAEAILAFLKKHPAQAAVTQ
ncbi:MAG: alpha/beta hydrolase [Candidatus Hydrogenedentota bacterium]